MQINTIKQTNPQSVGSIYRIQHTCTADKIRFDKYIAPMFAEQCNEPAMFFLGKNPLEAVFHSLLPTIAKDLGGSASWLKLNMQKFGRKAPSTEDTTSWVVTGNKDVSKALLFLYKHKGPKLSFIDRIKLNIFGIPEKDLGIPQHLFSLFKILDNIEAATPKFEKIMQKSKIEECKNIEDFALKFFTKKRGLKRPLSYLLLYSLNSLAVSRHSSS